MAACVCAHVPCMRVRACVRACVRAYVRASVRASMRASERTIVRDTRACLHAWCVRSCVCVRGGGRGRGSALWRCGVARDRSGSAREQARVQARGLGIGARGGETCWHGGLAVRGAALGREDGRDAGAGGEGGPNARGRARGGWWSARGGHAGAGSGRCGRVGWRSHRGGRNEVERRSFSGEFFHIYQFLFFYCHWI